MRNAMMVAVFVLCLVLEVSTAIGKESVGITPMAGAGFYTGDLQNVVETRGSFGLAVEIPVSPLVSAEIEGSANRFQYSYLFRSEFTQYGLGGNLKLYAARDGFRPYIGGGLLGMYMDQQTFGPFVRNGDTNIIGSGQVMAGADVPVGEKVSLGARGAYVTPLINKTGSIANQSLPGNSSFAKVLGTVRFGL